MLIDHFIDELLRLQTRHAGLIWRLWEGNGVSIEFYLEELALDCSTCLQKSGIPTDYRTAAARVVRIPLQTIQTDLHGRIIQILRMFLETNAVRKDNKNGNSHPRKGANDEPYT